MHSCFPCSGRDNLEIRCLATTPPVCEEDVFDISTWSNPNAVLSVPRESIDLYKSVEPWSRFGSFGTIKEASVGEIYIDDGECVIYNPEEQKCSEVISRMSSIPRPAYTYSKKEARLKNLNQIKSAILIPSPLPRQSNLSGSTPETCASLRCLGGRAEDGGDRTEV